LRLSGRGVAGRDGTAKLGCIGDGMVSSVADALVLRFLGTVLVLGFFATLVYLVSLFIEMGTAGVELVLLATRAERLRDMVKPFWCLRKVMVWET
jgi:hypothetical protein